MRATGCCVASELRRGEVRCGFDAQALIETQLRPEILHTGDCCFDDMVR